MSELTVPIFDDVDKAAYWIAYSVNPRGSATVSIIVEYPEVQAMARIMEVDPVRIASRAQVIRAKMHEAERKKQRTFTSKHNDTAGNVHRDYDCPCVEE